MQSVLRFTVCAEDECEGVTTQTWSLTSSVTDNKILQVTLDSQKVNVIPMRFSIDGALDNDSGALSQLAC